MSRLSLAIAGALLLVACAKDGTTVEVSGAKDNFEVTKLFTQDSCTVYRFYDGGRYRYFTNCSGTTMHTESCGKNCSRNTEIPGGK